MIFRPRTSRAPYYLLGILTVFCLAFCGCVQFAPTSVEPTTLEYLSPIASVDGIYPSMMGPKNYQPNLHLNKETAELVWITGYRAEMVDARAQERRPDELMCHNTLSFHYSLEAHSAILGSGLYTTRRLFTLSQGQSNIQFPDGFGIPALSSEPLMLQSQILNLNKELIGSRVRHKVETQFVPESKTEREMTPLTLVERDIRLRAVSETQLPDDGEDFSGCGIDAGGQQTHDREAAIYTGHWIVKPGRETRRTLLKDLFPYDTTVHFMSAHMHAYGESLELLDLTTGQSLFKANCKASLDGKRLEKIEHFSSQDGIEVYKNHRYQLVSRYNNTSNQEQTAMAILFIYMKDQNFVKPTSSTLQDRSQEFCGSERKPENF